MIHLIHWLLRLLLSCAGLYALLSAITILREGRSEEIIPITRIELVKQKIAELVLIVLAFFLGSFVGYMYGYHQYGKDRFTFTEVLIINRHDNRNFTVQPERMQPKEWTTCTEVDWKRGQKIKYIQYQQELSCKDVVMNGEYEFHHDKNGERLIYEVEQFANVR